ncbi:MAG: beta-lactamase family protein [Alphaproteobacteria bacterium]|nr:beta-lactamase family protein [Alphaproteobacteria bacterium]
MSPRLLLVALLLVGPAPLAQADAPPPPMEDAALSSALHALLEASVPADAPGAVLRVRRGDTVLLREARGLADVPAGVPLTPEHTFRLGSVTKQFAAIVVLTLVEEGRIALDQPIRALLPEYPAPQGDQVTVAHLLTHTSGIPSFNALPGFADRAGQEVSREEAVAFFAAEPLLFEPGTAWAYSNSGYFLLGVIAERVTGTPFEQLLQERVIAPAGLQDTRLGDPPPGTPLHAQGHGRTRAGDWVHAPPISMAWPFTAGGIVSSADDLERWDRALREGRIVSAETLERAWTPVVLQDGTPLDRGQGWFLGEVQGHPAAWHGGAITGFLTHVVHVPALDLHVAALTNGAAVDPSTLARRAVQIVLGEPLPGPGDPEPRLTPAELGRLAGVYRIDDHTVRRVVVRKGGILTQRSSGGGRARPRILSPTRFLYEQDLSVLEFVVEDGQVVAQELTPWGSAWSERAERVP